MQMFNFTVKPNLARCRNFSKFSVENTFFNLNHTIRITEMFVKQDGSILEKNLAKNFIVFHIFSINKTLLKQKAIHDRWFKLYLFQKFSFIC